MQSSRSRHSCSDTAGFTLVEVAIVLVLIGLLVAGVLVARDMIANAAVRGAAADTQKMYTAFWTFKDKYHCTPGDCEKASNFLQDAVNGDGNKLISCMGSEPECTAEVSQEQVQVFAHLSQAQLIRMGAPTGNEYPATKIGSCQFYIFENRYTPTWLYGAATGNFIWLTDNTADGHANCMTPAEARNLDRKLDDGFAGTGRVYGYARDNADYHDCVSKPYDDGPQPQAEYNVLKDDVSCMLQMQLD